MGGVWDFLGFSLGLCGGLYGKGGRGYTGGMKLKKTLMRQKMFIYKKKLIGGEGINF